MLTGYNILCLAPADWEAVNKVNCHHIMERLSEANKVLFVDSIRARFPALSEAPRALNRVGAFFRGVRQAKRGVYVVSPLVIPRYDSTLWRKINGILLRSQVRWAASRIALHEPIVWVFNPYTVEIVQCLEPRLVIYHCVDNYAANPGTSGQHMRNAELKLLQLTHLVFATSRGLYDRLSQLHPNVHYDPNFANISHFRQALVNAWTIPEELERLPTPRIGYIGNIAEYKLDFKLLEELISSNPNWSFVFIGPVGIGDPHTNITPLARLANARFLGPRSYEELPRYLKGIDVCIIPFRLNDVTKDSFPMKFFEYLAAGKPVVATELPSLSEFAHLFATAQNAQSFSAAIRDALKRNNDESRSWQLSNSVSEYGWNRRIEDLSSAVIQAICSG